MAGTYNEREPRCARIYMEMNNESASDDVPNDVRSTGSRHVVVVGASDELRWV